MSALTLKVKIKTLATESKYIRKEEHKQIGYARFLCGIFSKKHPKGNPLAERPAPDFDKMFEKLEDQQSAADNAYDEYWNLSHHRKFVVRQEARSSLLAYAFLRNVPYASVESNGCYEIPDFEYVYKISQRFSDLGDNALKAKFSDWMTAADDHLRVVNA